VLSVHTDGRTLPQQLETESCPLSCSVPQPPAPKAGEYAAFRLRHRSLTLETPKGHQDRGGKLQSVKPLWGFRFSVPPQFAPHTFSMRTALAAEAPLGLQPKQKQSTQNQGQHHSVAALQRVSTVVAASPRLI
jgi:hypothetical protein